MRRSALPFLADVKALWPVGAILRTPVYRTPCPLFTPHCRGDARQRGVRSRRLSGPRIFARGEESMVRKIAYWGSTAIVALMLLMALSYLSGNEQVVTGFAKAGYPQHLRIVLGLAKPAAAVVLLLPGLALLKEWAYAGATFAWVMASISARAAGEGPQIWTVPLVLLLLLAVSYATRPAARRVGLGRLSDDAGGTGARFRPL